jgi:hypothetical protein
MWEFMADVYIIYNFVLNFPEISISCTTIVSDHEHVLKLSALQSTQTRDDT